MKNPIQRMIGRALLNIGTRIIMHGLKNIGFNPEAVAQQLDPQAQQAPLSRAERRRRAKDLARRVARQ
jgi:hypothetical protein